MSVLEKILVAILEDIGFPTLLRVVAARTPPEVARAALEAEYQAIRAAIDAEAKAVLEEP